jgi:thiol-disulfide isomerase/thioredoxin
VHVVDAWVTREFFDAKVMRSFSLPQLRAYDGTGRRLIEITGFDEETFAAQLAPVLTLQAKPLHAPKLKAELAKMEAPGGGPLPGLPAADVTFVKLTAKWCLPCHAQTPELARVLAQYPNIRVNVIHADTAQERWAAPPPGE